jgi:hypothetical protein
MFRLRGPLRERNLSLAVGASSTLICCNEAIKLEERSLRDLKLNALMQSAEAAVSNNPLGAVRGNLIGLGPKRAAIIPSSGLVSCRIWPIDVPTENFDASQTDNCVLRSPGAA